MDNLLKILYNEDDSVEIVHTCQLAVREMLKREEIHHNPSEKFNWIELDHAESCFMMVFLSNTKNVQVLPHIVQALTTLMALHPPTKIQLGDKGMLFNVMELFQIYQSDAASDMEYLKCAYKLSIALLESCSHNYKSSMESGLISLIHYSFENCCDYKEIMTYCLHLLDILIVNDEEDSREVSDLKSILRCQCFEDEGNMLPVSAWILFTMNRFIKDSPELQLHGLMCLSSIAITSEGIQQVCDNGVLDTIVHTCSYHDGHRLIQKQCFLLIAAIVETVGYEKVACKVNDLFRIISAAMEKSLEDESLMNAICKALELLKLLLFRKELMLAACEDSNVGLAVCLLYFGFNMNFTFATTNSTFLSAACRKQEETMVKQIIGLVSSFQHLGLWKSRIEKISPCVRVTCSNQDHHITAALLWYLVDRDLNGIAEWNKLGLSRLKADWLETAFAAKNKPEIKDKKSLEILHKTKWFQLGSDILAHADALSTDLLKNKFSRFWSPNQTDKTCPFSCPLQELQKPLDDSKLSAFAESSENEDEAYEMNISEFTCPHCSPITGFRDMLKISFDEETLLEETIHRNVVAQCTCYVQFPPPHLCTVPVTSIQLSHNELTSINAFADLTRTTKERLCCSVKQINLFDNKLTSFPSSVAQMFSVLVELILSKNQLISFPFHILKHCPNLEILDLADNMIQDCLSFTGAEERAAANEKKKIFENYPHHLKSLKLTSNSLVEFPTWILCTFPKLTNLELRKNLINSLLEEDVFEKTSLSQKCDKQNTSNLEHFDISQNHITEFSSSCLLHWPNLHYLNLSQNELGLIESSGSKHLSASKLNYLDLSNNHLVELPAFVAYLPKLQTLLLSNNGLSSVQPSKRWACKAMKQLDISSNKIVDISALVNMLARRWPSTLKSLNLSNNNIQLLPSIVGELKALEVLDISRNCLRVLPDELGRLSNLTSFLIKDNQLNLEESIINGRAQEIRQFLYARLKKSVPQNRVKLMLVGDPRAGKTTLLKSLMRSRRRSRTFSGNSIFSGGVDNKSNQPTTLSTVGVDVVEVNVKHGDKLLTSPSLALANKMSDIPYRCEYGKRKMFHGSRYLSSDSLQEFVVRIKRPKCVHVPLRYVGRSSHRLGDRINNMFRKLSEKETTESEINQIVLVNQISKMMLQLSVWDFAGQEDFYATHPCFMSERAMYIALYDASQGPQQLQTLKPWLTAIHARAAHCPVLIIGSHADLLPRNKEEITALLKRELLNMSRQKWFPRGGSKSSSVNHELVDVREASYSIAHLKNVIFNIISESVVHGQPLVGGKVPYNYVKLTELLEREANKRSEFPVISFNELASLVRSDDDTQRPQFDSGSELMMAVKYLHQIGVLLHFDDPRSRLRDCFFIKPAWICKLLAQVVTMKDDSSYKVNPYINKEGILSKTKFAKNFVLDKSSKALPNQFLPHLFRLLENFEIVLWKGGDLYLVPSKLPTTKPDIQLPVTTPDNLIIRYFSMVYIPMGLWPRLSARLLAFSNKLLHGYSASHCSDTVAPLISKTWSRGMYFEWKSTERNEIPFVLVQSGSKEYSNALNRRSDHEAGGLVPDQYEAVEWDVWHRNDAGLEVIVPRSSSGQILLAQLVDHVTNLIEEWYPGLLNLDRRGKSFFQQYSPCFICCATGDASSNEVTSFCINDLAESVLCNKTPKSYADQATYEVMVSDSGVLLVYCPFHPDTPVPVAQLAPEINLDDFDPSLRLDPSLLYFEASPRRMLGGGGFGAVYQATYDNEDVAIKTFYASTSDMSYKMLRAELNVLAQHRHPSIIALKGFIPPAFSKPSLPLPLLAIEYAKLGSLGKLLCNMTTLPVQARKSALSPSIRHRIAYEVADGLCFLHRQNIVYRDLKPDNILLTSLSYSSPTIAKITDYGISTLASPSGVPGASGSPGYSAPEVVTLKCGSKHSSNDLFPYSMKCDIYSYGLLLHELAVGRSPWVDYVYEEHYSDKGTHFNSNQPDEIILKGILPSPLSSYEGATAWPYAQELITECLRRNPEERLSSCQLLSTLSDIQSACLRSSISLLPPDPVVARIYPNECKGKKFVRSSSMFADTRSFNENQSHAQTVDIFYHGHPSYHDLANVEPCCVMRLVLDVEEGLAVRNDDVYVQLESDVTISCMIQLSSSFSQRKANIKRSFYSPAKIATDEPLLIAGTLQGHLLVISSPNFTVKHKFSHAVSSLHHHKPFESSHRSIDIGSCYVLVSLEDSTLHVYTVEQIINSYEKRPLHVLDLSNFACGPASVMMSSGTTVRAACRSRIISLAVADSGPPIVLGALDADDPVQAFSIGLEHFYTSSEESSRVSVWPEGGAGRRTVLFTAKDLFQKQKSLFLPVISVTSLYVDVSRSSLWVGLSMGQVLVYSIPQHNVLAVLHRNAGPVVQIFHFSGTNSEEDVVICLGEGNRTVSDDLLEFDDNCIICDDDVQPQPTPRNKGSQIPFYLTLWDADLPKKAVAFKSVLNAREKL